MPWTEHLLIAPIIIPLLTAAALLFLDETQRYLKAAITGVAVLVLLAVAFVLVHSTHGAAEPRTAVYLVGNWPPPFAIVLVLDRLSALMVALVAVLSVPVLLFSVARWNSRGSHFHPLFLLLLMGLNGAFLTGDLFNLFVFFEVMLAASYGLALHGSGPRRVRAGLHYIAVNLAASLLFLIGVAIIYGVTGTLNMADLATRIPDVAGADRALLEVGAGILGLAFLVKAGMWPLSFWLPMTYSAAAAPVAAIFAVLSKVGVYILLRLSLLFFGEDAGELAGFGSRVLLIGGLATVVFGAIGILASQALDRMAGYAVLVSSGTLLAAFGLINADVTAGALFYLVSSTLTIAALFLMIELVDRGKDAASDVLSVSMEVFVEGEEEEEETEVGVAIPGTLATLGIAFAMCGLLLAGLPPLSGFIAKFAMFSAMISPAGSGEVMTAAWWFTALVILSGLAALVAMSRAGIRIFWASGDSPIERMQLVEFVPIAMLLVAVVAVTVLAGPLMDFMGATSQALHAPQGYIDSVMEAPVSSPGEPHS